MAALFSASWFLMHGDVWLPSIGMYLSTTLVFVGLVTSGYFTETREKRLVRRYFERYVNDSVLEQILANPNSVDLKGHVIDATIMATDIRDFTHISEEMDPYDVVSRLNDYLEEVSEVLIDRGAFINKYIGDAILALFGAFKVERSHQEQACRAALDAMKVIARKAGEARARGEAPFITRFGLNTGRMTMGNIGSARKIEYTVIGDAVNSAFRLESLNKFYGTLILASEFTREGAGDGFEFRLLDALQFKGKDRPVRVYELLGEKGGVEEAILRRRDAYERAFGLYTARKFGEALEEFSRLRAEGDDAANVLEKRCRLFLETPPAEDWTGVWKMDEK
jgi:adenylate cyclase